jgi:ferredoxin-NADP reductase
VALAFAHQLAVGSDFIEDRTAQVVWTGAHLTVLAAVIWFRLAQPVYRSWRQQFRVTAIRQEAPDVVSIYVGGRDLDRLGARAGQFFRWRFLTRGCWWQAHPFSLSAPPGPDGLRVTVKIVGNHTDSLRRLTPGTRVIAEGPYGAVTPHLRTRRKVLLVAGGIGITPLRALYESLPASSGDLALLYRASSDDDVIFVRELEELAASRGSALHFVVGPRQGRRDPLSTELTRRIPDVAERDVYVCGPPAMIDSTQHALLKAGVPCRHIHAERFDM